MLLHQKKNDHKGNNIDRAVRKKAEVKAVKREQLLAGEYAENMEGRVITEHPTKSLP